MKRKEQDKLWAYLSEEKKKEYKERYNIYLTSVRTETYLSNYEWGIKEGEVRILIDTFGEHNLKPALTLTYEDVAKELFPKDRMGVTSVEIMTFSEQHADKISSINSLICTAKFLNKNEDGSDWTPTIEDWDYIDKDDFFTLGINPDDNEIHVIEVNKQRLATEIVYFRTEEIARQAVQILGEDVIRTALTTKY